ncbi:MAG TPA: THUMP domain-containing protein [Salinivirgaceae bacterium]|nr:THUMP domain-containing protein [Salinivirgaceae bacterium]
MEKFEIIATTFYGLEETLAEELKEIGVKETSILNRAVRFHGDTELLYRANYLLRTAVKILKPIAVFRANNDNQLYNQIREIEWEKFLSVKKSFAVDAITNSRIFTHSQYAAYRVKDGIVDQFKAKHRLRPTIDPQKPDVQLNVHISDNLVIVSLDSSGEPLFRRNYRLEQVEAPINEVLASAILRICRWDKKTPLYDPMCGSGTFPIEAALTATNTPAGKFRKFNFQNWLDFDNVLFQKIQQETEEQIIPLETEIVGSDINRKAIEIATNNARRAGMRKLLRFEHTDFFETSRHEPTFVTLNPPYDHRFQMEKIEEFYEEIGSHLKHHYTNSRVCLISSNMEALKRFGLKPKQKFKLFNGPLECRLLIYDIFQGTLKEQKENNQ